ncbi:DMT family transporter [Nocardioides acrostichi]|uniref:DMT family transporter n=1 Tax=Nocardioides acrostichi TaxID=2784339 RepID=A0A930UZX3_9ACTN|nr:DMT family transporter [Nocardioides acrostichi]MBF4161474.1 DMT family transporter [Nocardioides acrostichi]
MTTTAPGPLPPEAPARTAPPWAPLVAIAITLLFWASAFVAIRHLRDDFSPGALSLGRLLVGAACLGVIVWRSGRGGRARLWPRGRREWASMTAIGVLWFGVYSVALNEGETRIDAGTAAMLIQLSPVLVAVMAALFLDERLSVTLLVGLALAFAGVALIGVSTSEHAGQDWLGVGLCLLSALAYSVSLILQKPLVARVPAVMVTWLACTVGAVVCLPFVGQLLTQAASAPASSVWWLVYLGVFPTAVAFSTFAYALTTMDASRLGVTTYLVPPLTIVLALVFLGETPPALAYLGGVLSLVGVAVARRRRA